MIILCVLLFLVLAMVVLAVGYVNYLLGRMNRVDMDNESTVSSSEAEDLFWDDPELGTIAPDSTEDLIHIDDLVLPTYPLETDDGGENTQSAQPTQDANDVLQGGNAGNAQSLKVVTGDHLINILLVGQDRREGQGRQRSDTMILLTVNKSTNEITLTSFMRDQYVSIPGYKGNKLNAAYQFGGMGLLTKTLRQNFGVAVDGVVEVDFGGFKDVIDLVGGVDINMVQKECDYFNTFTDWNLTPGINHLNGEQALAYSRLREIDSDYNRANRQRNVITAVINSCKQQSLTGLLDLLNQILPMVSTNMTNSQIIGYATDLFPVLAGAQLNTARIPVDGTFRQGTVKVRDGLTAWFQYNIDFYANNQYLNEIFRKES